jgi:hypothetical protein
VNTTDVPQVPWSADATEGEAQAAFNAVQLKYRVAFDAIKRGETVEIAVAGFPVELIQSLADAMTAQCLMVWGAAPLAVVTGGDFIKVLPHSSPPTPPLFCGSCGLVLVPTSSDLRWDSPGKAALNGHTGWEHKCHPHEPQAGYFCAAMDRPYGNDSTAATTYELERRANWLKCARQRASQINTLETSFRAKDLGHQFVEGAAGSPFCRQCGLAVPAFLEIPEDRRWHCPGEPPLPVVALIQEELAGLQREGELTEGEGHTPDAAHRMRRTEFLLRLKQDVLSFLAGKTPSAFEG